MASLRINATSSRSARGSSSKRKAARSMSPAPRKGIARCSETIVLPTPSKAKSTPGNAHRKTRGKGKGKTPARGKDTLKSEKYEHVHQYLSTGRWGAWYNDPTSTKLNRLYFGTHLTEDLAARAQDRALLMYRPKAIKPVVLNFDEKDYAEDKDLRMKLTKEEFVKLIRAESHACYTKVEPTACLVKFLRQEKALGHLPKYSKLLESGHVVNTKRSSGDLANKKGKSLAEYVEGLIRERPVAPPPPELTWLQKRPRTAVTYYDTVTPTMTCEAT